MFLIGGNGLKFNLNMGLEPAPLAPPKQGDAAPPP